MDIDQFHKYNKHLRPLNMQLKVLEARNPQLPEDQRIPGEWFEDICTTSDHVQSIEDLEVLIVWTGTLKESRHYGRSLIQLLHPKASDVVLDPYSLEARFDAHAYDWDSLEPGIYRIHINLVAHWSPNVSRSIDQVREIASKKKQILASFEAVLAYALQAPELIQLLDGINLPHIDVAGISTGDNLLKVPCFDMNKLIGAVQFFTVPVYVSFVSSAAPLLLGAPTRA